MKKICIMVLAVVAVLAAQAASGTVVSFPDFSSTAGLTLNGSAARTTTADGWVLRLTPATVNRSGSVFSSTTINAADFSTYFRFRITSPGGTTFDGNADPGADGIVFVVQSVSSSIGGMGQGIGYDGIARSVGVEFDTWHNSANYDPNSNHVGIDLNGSVNHGSGSPYTAPVTTRFDDGNVWHAWVDYNGTNLEVRLNQTGVRPLTALLSRAVDIPYVLGPTVPGGVDFAFVGFTSGTGADWGNHDILSWEYRDNFNPISTVPLPGAGFLLAPAFIGLAGLRRAFKR